MAEEGNLNSVSEAAAAHRRARREFLEKAAPLMVPNLELYYWYHAVDLGNGLVTPGQYDLRSVLPEYHFPEDMSGMTVLDVGSGSGFFAFEFERRGAQVTSVDLPDLRALDRFPTQSFDETFRRLVWHRTATPDDPESARFLGMAEEEYYFYHVDGPFRLCHRLLGSKVERRCSSIYDLTPELLGRDRFDMVFLGEILIHTLYPLRALAAAASFCADLMVICEWPSSASPDVPVMEYVGGTTSEEDYNMWWLLNRRCLEQILKRLGFSSIREVGRCKEVSRTSGCSFDHPIVHARRVAP